MSGAEGTAQGARTTLGDVATFAGGLHEVAAGAWVWLQPNGGLGESNAGLIVGEDESLLIDTLWDERLTASLLEAVGPVCERMHAPIRRLFNTHGDGDHWYGNGLLPREVEIVAAASAAAQMEREPPSMLTRLAPLGPLAGGAARLPRLPGRAHLRGLTDFTDQLGHYEFGGIEPRLPERTFSGTLALEVGGRTVELVEVGPAHSPGDAIAWLPDVRVVYAGDIVFSGVTPIIWTGPVENWIAALELIESYQPELVVGGHGPVADIAELQTMRDYWLWLRDRVAAGLGERTLDLTEGIVRSSEFGERPWGAWRNPERTLVNVARIADGIERGRRDLSVLDRIRLLAGMGALRERLAV